MPVVRMPRPPACPRDERAIGKARSRGRISRHMGPGWAGSPQLCTGQGSQGHPGPPGRDPGLVLPPRGAGTHLPNRPGGRRRGSALVPSPSSRDSLPRPLCVLGCAARALSHHGALGAPIRRRGWTSTRISISGSSALKCPRGRSFSQGKAPTVTGVQWAPPPPCAGAAGPSSESFTPTSCACGRLSHPCCRSDGVPGLTACASPGSV